MARSDFWVHHVGHVGIIISDKATQEMRSKSLWVCNGAYLPYILDWLCCASWTHATSSKPCQQAMSTRVSRRRNTFYSITRHGSNMVRPMDQYIPKQVSCAETKQGIPFFTMLLQLLFHLAAELPRSRVRYGVDGRWILGMAQRVSVWIAPRWSGRMEQVSCGYIYIYIIIKNYIYIYIEKNIYALYIYIHICGLIQIVWKVY